MRNAVLASLLGLTALLNTGCPGAFSCGGFDEGTSNRVYERGDADMLILCSNGGFVAQMPAGTVEGFYYDNGDGTGFALRGEDGELAFDVQQDAAGMTTPQLGEGAWSSLELGPTALHHSNALCEDLEYRRWWSAE